MTIVRIVHARLAFHAFFAAARFPADAVNPHIDSVFFIPEPGLVTKAE